MHHIGRSRLVWMLGLFLLGACFFFVGSPASADDAYAQVAEDGEPTNPEDIIGILAVHGVYLDEYDLTDTEPADEADALSWFMALLDLLRSVIPTGDSSP